MAGITMIRPCVAESSEATAAVVSSCVRVSVFGRLLPSSLCRGSFLVSRRHPSSCYVHDLDVVGWPFYTQTHTLR